MPKVVPPKGIPEFHSDQSKHEHLPSIPLRAVIVGPSGCGKTLLLVTMITELYTKGNGKSVFKRIYVFSPSVHADPAWPPVKKYVKEELKVPDSEDWAFDHYDQLALERIIATQREIIAAAKQKKLKKLFNVLIVIDDFSDNPAFSRRDTLLHSLFTRGRHAFISSVVSSHKFRAQNPIIRCNATCLIIFRLRSEQELLAIVEEISAVYPKDVIVNLIRYATTEPYSFLYVDLAARKPDEMFWLRFEKRLVPRDFDSDEGDSASDG